PRARASSPPPTSASASTTGIGCAPSGLPSSFSTPRRPGSRGRSCSSGSCTCCAGVRECPLPDVGLTDSAGRGLCSAPLPQETAMKTRVPLLLSLVFAAACSDSSVTGPAPLGRVVAAPTVAGAAAATRITVMTRNLYIGADVDQVITTLVFGPVSVSVVDHDAILVDASRVETFHLIAAPHFTNNIGPLAGGLIDLERGFVLIDATISGVTVKVANTHLEAGVTGVDVSLLRAAQAGELVTAVGTGPAILLGDFNSTQTSLAYAVVTGAPPAGGGFTDAWAALRPGAPGLTCCELPDLSNHVNVLSGRIDYVLVRGLAGPQGRLLGQVTIVGDQPGDRVPGLLYPVWPSDHAGVVASLLLPPAQGLAAR